MAQASSATAWFGAPCAELPSLLGTLGLIASTDILHLSTTEAEFDGTSVMNLIISEGMVRINKGSSKLVFKMLQLLSVSFSFYYSWLEILYF